MHKFLLAFALICSGHVCAQQLLANGGLEDVNVCTEYRIECAPEAWMSSASGFINFFRDANRSHSGENCLAIEAAHFQKKYNRTYLRSQLLCGLRKGSTYRIEFYIKSIHPILDSVAILFTANDPLFEKAFMRDIKPTIFLKGNVEPNESGDSAWRKVQVDYQANGEEAFLLLGYFAKEDYRGKRFLELENRYFIFFDDFSMVPLDPNEHICPGWKQVMEDIYDDNARHELLERKIKYYRSKPPPPPQLEKNSYTIIDTVLVPDILFQSGKANLQSGSFTVLDSIARSVNGKQIDSLVLKGHTDNTGSASFNEMLSLDRAKTVADYIAPRVSKMPVPVFVYGLADREPVTDNNNPTGREKNRRVEILVYLRE